MTLIQLQKGKKYRVRENSHYQPMLSFTSTVQGSEPGQEFVTTTTQTLPSGSVIEYCGKQRPFLLFATEESKQVGILNYPHFNGTFKQGETVHSFLFEEVTNG